MQLRLAAATLIGAILASVTVLPRAGAAIAFAAFHLYVPQLAAHRSFGGHVTVLYPSVLLTAACSPPGELWPVAMVRLCVAISYCSSGYGKVVASIRLHAFWGSASTLQFYMLQYTWTRRWHSSVEALFGGFRQWVILRRWFLTSMASATLLMQVGAPLALLSDHAAGAWALCALGFHLGVAILLELDFVSFWSAPLLAFGVPLGQSSLSVLWHARTDPWIILPAVYTLGQLACVVMRHDGALPWSTVPMFQLPRSFTDSLPMQAVIAPRSHGWNPCTMEPHPPEPVYWAPTSSTGMTREDLRLLWSPILWFGTTRNLDRMKQARDGISTPCHHTTMPSHHTRCRHTVQIFWRDSVEKKIVGDGGQYVISNFKRSRKLDVALQAVLAHMGGAEAADLPVALVLQRECWVAFDECVAEVGVGECEF